MVIKCKIVSLVGVEVSNICKTHERSIKKTKKKIMYSRKKTHLGLIWLFYGNWQMVHLPNMDKRHRVVLTLVTASVGTDVAWY